MKYIFIDESGELGNQTKNILIAALIVNEKDKDKLDRIIKNLRRGKHRDFFKEKNEIKANKLTYEIKIEILKMLNNIKNIEINVINFYKNNSINHKIMKDKNKLYDYIAGELVSRINIDSDIEIIIDKSKGKKILERKFNSYIIMKVNTKYKINIKHRHSHAWKGLQFADLIAWSYFQKYEHGNDEYINLLEVEKNTYSI